MSDNGDLLTLSRCAKLLTDSGDKISRQGLSKYCDTHCLKQETPDGIRVSFQAVKAHRSANYQREVMSGGVELPASDAAPAVQAEDAAKIVALDPSRRQKEAQASKLELELARMRNEVVLADEVTAGIADITVRLRQSLLQAVPNAAQRIAAELSLEPEEERELRASIKAVIREGLAAFVDDAAQMNADLTHDDVTATRDRIGKLAVVSALLQHRPDRQISMLQDRAG